MTIIVTGGCGFIGTNFVREWLSVKNETLINIDKLTPLSRTPPRSRIRGIDFLN